MEKTITFDNPIKVIKSGNVPSTSNLAEGNIAYGKVNSKNTMYVRIGSQVVAFYSAATIDDMIGDIDSILDAVNGEEI